MTKNYLEYFPTPLLDDLVADRWLPVIGAGFSRNAVLSKGRAVPLWDELGRSLADELGDYDYINPTDAISAFAHDFGRPKLIEKLSDLLYLGEAQPGDAHRAFCSLQFDLVCTTNFDFLLETQYTLTARPFTPLIDEDQLAVNRHRSNVSLLKLHGDLNHPKRLVVTEQDYDLFLEQYPVIATFLANLLITRTAVLVGYSLDDPDFRQLWQVVGQRLGGGRRAAYVLCVGARSVDVARYERRGVKVINLGHDKNKYRQVLSEVFEQLKEYWADNVIEGSEIREEDSLRELSLPKDSPTRLCFFAIPMAAQPFYRERVFPVVREFGLVPVTADEIIVPGENVFAKVDALVSRAFVVVVDLASRFTRAEAARAFTRKAADSVCTVIEEGTPLPRGTEYRTIIHRPNLASVEVGPFIEQLENWLEAVTRELKPKLAQEMERLLDAKEYRAAVISAITSLETALRECVKMPGDGGPRLASMRQLVQNAHEGQRLGGYQVRQVLDWLRVRNGVVHSQARVLPDRARTIVRGVDEILKSLSR